MKAHISIPVEVTNVYSLMEWYSKIGVVFYAQALGSRDYSAAYDYVTIVLQDLEREINYQIRQKDTKDLQKRVQQAFNVAIRSLRESLETDEGLMKPSEYDVRETIYAEAIVSIKKLYKEHYAPKV